MIGNNVYSYVHIYNVKTTAFKQNHLLISCYYHVYSQRWLRVQSNDGGHGIRWPVVVFLMFNPRLKKIKFLIGFYWKCPRNICLSVFRIFSEIKTTTTMTRKLHDTVAHTHWYFLHPFYSLYLMKSCIFTK